VVALFAAVPIVAVIAVASEASLLGVKAVEAPDAVVTEVVGLKDAVNPGSGYVAFAKLQTIGTPA